MALGTFYTNWSSDHDTTTGASAAYSSLFRPPSPELPPELFSFNESSTLYDNCINQIFDPIYNNNNNNNLEFPTYSDVLPPTATTTTVGHVITPSPEFQVSTFSYENPYFNHLPFSTTFDHNHHHHQHLSHFFMMEYPMVVPPSQPSPLPEFYYGGGGGATLSSSWYDGGSRNGDDKVEESSRVIQVIGKQNSGGDGGGMVRLSAQSMAARVRRRKISEKTQELGKLIPGGHKMNTAEMFQAAFKYIKFLQAQVGVLKLMASIPEGEQVMDNGELMEALVTCTSMQEKLYTAEKCIVSKHFAETLAIN